MNRLLLDLAWKRFSEIWIDTKQIAIKAGVLLISNTLFVCFVIDSTLPYRSYIVIPFLCSILLCVGSVYPRSFKTFDLKKLLADLSEYSEDKLVEKLYGALAVKEEYNAKQVESMANYLRLASLLFAFAVLVLLASFL